MMREFKLFGFLAAAAVTVILVLGGIFGAFYTVDEGERAVITRNGEIIDTAEPGLHFKMPFIDSTHVISTRTEAVSYEGLEAFTFDQQTATIEAIHITFRIPTDRVAEVYGEFKTPEALIDRYVGRRVNAELERIFGQYSAERTVRERAKLSAEVSAALRSVPNNAPVEIMSVEIASIAYPDSYSQRVNARMNAEIEVAKLEQEVRQAQQERLKQQEVADAAAYARRSAADADAHAIRVRGEAEADAIRLRSKALEESPALIELTKAERWDGVLPTSMVPGSTVPFLGIK